MEFFSSNNDLFINDLIPNLLLFLVYKTKFGDSVYIIYYTYKYLYLINIINNYYILIKS